MRCALFGPVYRCGVFATWIDVVRRCKIIFLPTISSNFCLVPQLGRPEGRSGPPAPAPSSSTGYHDGCDRNAPFHRGDPANHWKGRMYRRCALGPRRLFSASRGTGGAIGGRKVSMMGKGGEPSRWCPKRPEIDRLMASQSPFLAPFGHLTTQPRKN